MWVPLGPSYLFSCIFIPLAVTTTFGIHGRSVIPAFIGHSLRALALGSFIILSFGFELDACVSGCGPMFVVVEAVNKTGGEALSGYKEDGI